MLKIKKPKLDFSKDENTMMIHIGLDKKYHGQLTKIAKQNKRTLRAEATILLEEILQQKMNEGSK